MRCMIETNRIGMADPLHIAAESAGQDASGQVLRPSRGFREAQGRVRGNFGFPLRKPFLDIPLGMRS